MNELSVLTLNMPNILDFSEERNKLLRKCKTKWALFLDSDERLNTPIKNISGEYSGYYLTRKNYFLGYYVGSDKILRMGQKDHGKWSRNVHETWDIQGKLGYLPNIIIHNTATNLTSYLKKINYYSDLHAIANRKEGKVSNIFKIIIFPIGKFVLTFVKSKNVVFSIMQSLHSYLSWTKLYFLQP